MKPGRRKILFSKFSIKKFPGIFLTVLLILLGAYLLGWSSLLSLRVEVIYGTQKLSLIHDAIVQTTPKIVLKEPLARVDVNALERQILKSEWISKVVIGRDWLHGKLEIRITEREPVASYLSSDGQLRYFDKSGFDFYSPTSYPGIPLVNMGSGSLSDRKKVTEFIVALSPSILEKAQSFSITQGKNLEMRYELNSSRTVTIFWGDSRDISLKEALFAKLVALKENEKSTLFNLENPLNPITK